MNGPPASRPKRSKILRPSLHIYTDASEEEDHCAAAFYSPQYVGIQGRLSLLNPTLCYLPSPQTSSENKPPLGF